jgi:hypothetical protein
LLIIAHWFRAFVWTLLLEQAVAGLVLRRAIPQTSRRVSVIAVANVASHPAVWLIFPELGASLGWPYLSTLLLSEAWAFGLEAWIYWLFLGSSKARLALIASTSANAVSLALGFGLRWLDWV